MRKKALKMTCYYHPDRPASVQCGKCGKLLCSECGGLIQPPTCLDCVSEHVGRVKTEMVVSIVISVVLMIAGCLVIKSPLGILLAGIPYGWSILNRVTPSMFLWLSWVGWIVYFLLKIVLSYFIGLIALPIKIFKWVSELGRVKKLQSSVYQRIG